MDIVKKRKDRVMYGFDSFIEENFPEFRYLSKEEIEKLKTTITERIDERFSDKKYFSDRNNDADDLPF